MEMYASTGLFSYIHRGLSRVLDLTLTSPNRMRARLDTALLLGYGVDVFNQTHAELQDFQPDIGLQELLDIDKDTITKNQLFEIGGVHKPPFVTRELREPKKVSEEKKHSDWNEQFGDTEGHENRGSAPLQISGNEIILGARGSYSPHTLNITTLQQGELSILNFDECGPQLPVTDFRHLHESHEFTSAASHTGSTFLHGICLRNIFNYDNDTNNFRIHHFTDYDTHSKNPGYYDYDYENALWIPDNMDYDEEKNYRIRSDYEDDDDDSDDESTHSDPDYEDNDDDDIDD